MDYKTKVLAGLIFLAIVDAVIPVPVIGLFLIYVITTRPLWFSDLVAQIYGRAEGGELTGQLRSVEHVIKFFFHLRSFPPPLSQGSFQNSNNLGSESVPPIGRIILTRGEKCSVYSTLGPLWAWLSPMSCRHDEIKRRINSIITLSWFVGGLVRKGF